MAFMPSLSREAREKLNQMLQNDELTDLTVKGDDSDSCLQVHAICIASLSTKFRGKVRPGSHEGEVTFPFPFQVLKAIIGIAYHGRIEDNFLSRWLEDALRVSFQFEVKELQDAIKDYLRRKLTVENMIYFWDLVKSNFDNCEGKRIVKFISRNVDKLTNKEILSFSIHDLKEILSCEHLNMTRTSAEKLVKSYVQAHRITRTSLSGLKSLAKIPTRERIPRAVILAVGGWGEDAPT